MSRVAKNGRIWPQNATLHTDKDLKQKILGGKMFICQGYGFKKEIWNQSQKKFGLKKAYLYGSP